MTRTVIAVLVLLAVVFGLYRWGFSKGWAERDAEMQAVIAQKNEESRQTEQRLTEQINTNATKLQEANHVVSEKQSALDRSIRNGRVRLPAPSCVQATASATTPTGDRNEARTEPDRQADQPSDAERETLALIAQIAADGDKAINQLNSCIDAYNEVRNQLNANR